MKRPVIPIRETKPSINYKEVFTIVRELLNEIMEEEGVSKEEFKIIDMKLVGSRSRNTHRPNSDIDIIVGFKGNSRSMFIERIYDLLNEKQPEYNGLKLDIGLIIGSVKDVHWDPK
jgi:predicted nucleotidyltransferase